MSVRARKIVARSRALAVLAVTLVGAGLFTGCGSIGLPGTGGGSPPPSYPQETVVEGQVVRVDTARREIEIDDSGRREVVVYDTTTPVYFEGRSYQPSDLERGDVIRARIADDRSGHRTTDRIDVVESVQSRGGSNDPYGNDPYDDRGSDSRGDRVGDLSGEIDRVDGDRHEIVLRTTSGDTLIAYDSRTRVYYQGQEYEPENLERGDLVEVETTSASGSRYAVAERIDVTRSVQDRGTYDDRPGTAERVSGTVDWVDKRSGEFGLRTDRETVTVEIPFDAAATTRDRFSRLDRGDYVRIEVEELDGARLALVRFL